MMREHFDRTQQKRNNAVRIIMAVLFALFVFLYIILFQNDLIAVMQETWSQGATHNNPIITAVIVTTLLLLLQTGLRNLFGIRGRWEAYSYLPSFMLLSLFTDVDTRTFHYHAQGKWILILLLAFVLAAVVPLMGRLLRQDHKTSFANLLWSNLAVYAISAVLCMTFTNHNAPFHMELAAYRYADKGCADRVARIGRRSHETTLSLTALRNVALCREGRAGDELFTLPQPWGVEGLMAGRYTRYGTRYGAEVWNRFVGARPYGGEGVLDFCTRLYRNDDNSFYRNLYMAALLLDCRITEFSREFPPHVMGDTLAPRHYREAWILTRHLFPDAGIDYQDPELEPLLNAFFALTLKSDVTPVVTANRCRLTFGNTYWNYYYGNSTLSLPKGERTSATISPL